MASREPRAVVTLEVEPSPHRAPVEIGPETPFCIALLGDFSGRALRGPGNPDASPLRSRRPVAVDRDDLDAVLARLAPRIIVPLDEGGAPSVGIGFTELDDFTPERLVSRLDIFAALRAAATSGPGGAAPGSPAPAPASGETAGSRPGEADAEDAPGANGRAGLAANLAGGNLLDRMLDEAGEPAAPASPATARDEMAEFLRRITAKHLVPGEDPEAAAARGRADALVAEQLRRILHQPRFQALEALWRAVFLLTRRLETGRMLRLYLVDVSRAELAADLANDVALEATALHRLLSEHGPAEGTAPWSLLVGLYDFGPAEDDVALLARAGGLARALGAAFVGGAEPALVGAPGFADGAEPETWSQEPSPEWAAFRRTSAARFVGLALPRFMLRLPYGREGELSDVRDFEEMEEPPRHEDYLWGNGATLCALLLGQAFSLEGWDLRPDRVAEVSGLPLHLYHSDGETLAKPCAECWMSEHAADVIMERGPMVLASMKNQDAVKLVRFQSVGDPLAALAGPWI